MSDFNSPFGAHNSSILEQFDFSNHDDDSSKVRFVNIIFICVTATIVCLRTGVRLFMIRTVGLDDGKLSEIIDISNTIQD
jgi:hypothetical protein